MKDAWMLREPRSHRLVAAGEVVGVGAEPSRKLLEPRVQEARRDCHLALVARERLQEPEEVHGDSLGKVLPAAESLALLLRGVQEGLEGHADPRTLRAGPPGGGPMLVLGALLKEWSELAASRCARSTAAAVVPASSALY